MRYGDVRGLTPGWSMGWGGMGKGGLTISLVYLAAKYRFPPAKIMEMH